MITTEYHLIVQVPSVPPARATWRSIEECATLEKLIETAADYEAGEYQGTAVGAFTLTYRDGRLISTARITDLDDQVYAELRLRPEWRERQRNQERYGRRDATV